MTMKELAKLANVSVSTISKAFCDADDISLKTKQHIFEIAKQYGCYGSFYKGKYHKKIIAVICPEISGNHYTTFVKHLQTLIEKTDGICVISTDDFSNSKQAELIEYYASYLKVDGLIVLGLKEKLKKGYDIPIVSIFSSVDTTIDSVNIEIEPAINKAVNILYSYGHRKIAFLGEKLTQEKEKKFIIATEKYNDIKYVTVQSDKRFEKAGIEGVIKLLKNKSEFTALICAYDHIAIGAIKQLKQNSIKVPEDVSVIGIDNIETSKYTETSLTTIDTHPHEACEIAWELMQKKINNKYFRAKQNILIQPDLIIRESITKAKV